MSNFCQLTFLLLVLTIASVSADDQFFEITKDGLPLSMDEPFLTSKDFECARTKSCKSLVRSTLSKKEEMVSETIFAMAKRQEIDRPFSTCAAALQWNGGKEGYYSIKHRNMAHAVNVECKVIDNLIHAIIHHDSEMETRVNGYEEPGSYKKEFRYANALGDLRDFVDSSVNCSQFTKIGCIGSLFYNAMIDVRYTFLVDRNGIKMSYIGGGSEELKGCACGTTNSCVEAGTTCNCDANDQIWRQDSGFVTEKHRLPLTGILMGDTGSANEKANHVIGPVQCTESDF